ncbi:MAG TPA: hypothetical protein IGS53_06205 [Leptolyngbyaceae cyanobacterium M33_DOE_097]|nr:hypothetical protein [Leptolyngbyaceae cyanobacterium M33_DOE_097]
MFRRLVALTVVSILPMAVSAQISRAALQVNQVQAFTSEDLEMICENAAVTSQTQQHSQVRQLRFRPSNRNGWQGQTANQRCQKFLQQAHWTTTSGSKRSALRTYPTAMQ